MNAIRSSWNLGHLLAARSEGAWRFTRPIFWVGDRLASSVIATSSLGMGVSMTATILGIRSPEEAYATRTELAMNVLLAATITGIFGKIGVRAFSHQKETAERIVTYTQHLVVFAMLPFVLWKNYQEISSGRNFPDTPMDLVAGTVSAIAGVKLGMQTVS